MSLWHYQWHWYNHMAHLVPYSTALAFLTNMSELHKSTHTMQSKWKTDKWQLLLKLDVISRLGKGEWVVDIWCNVRFAHSSMCTVGYNADSFAESAKSGPVASLPQPYWNGPYQKLWILVSDNFIALEINKYIVYKCMYSVYTVDINSTGPYVH